MNAEIKRLELLVRDLNLDHGATLQQLNADIILLNATAHRLRHQLEASKVVIAGLERRALAQAKELEALAVQAADVAGERAANAALTAELYRANLCKICADVRAAYKNPPCQQCGSMTPDDATSRCMARAADGGCHGTDLWPAL